MVITKVEPVTLAIPFTYGLESASRSTVKQLDFCLVRVETDAGIVGWGEAFSYNCRTAVAAAVRDMLAPLVVGSDAAAITEIHSALQKKLHIFGRFGITAFALSGLDIALWDIAGKAAGAPLHQLLGGALRTSVPCYASLLRYAEPDLVTRYCKRALSEGYTEIKLHEISVEAVAAARAAIGLEVPLTLDVNCEWTREGAIAMAKDLRQHRLKWLEEPVFPPEDFHGMRAVGEAAGIPIGSGENLCFATQFEAAFEAGAIAYAQPSVTKVGGVTEFQKVVKAAALRNVRVAPHSPYFGPGAIATLHLLATAVPDARFEHFYLWPEASLYPGFFGKPELGLPQGAGLGLDPDPDVIRRYRV